MQPNRLLAVKKLGSSVHLIAVICLITAAIVLVACSNNDTAQKPQSLTGQSPSPTSTPTPTPENVPPADTIIVIRDGSVHIKVDTGRCEDDDQADMKGYKCKGVIMTELWTSTGPTKLALDEKSKITINGGGDRGKDIKIQKNGDDVKITFKKDQYNKPCPGGTIAGEHCGDNRVGIILVEDPGFSQTCDKCVFWVSVKPR